MAKLELQSALQLESENAQCHFELGNVFARLGAIEDANREYQRAIELDPDMAEAHYQLGLSYVKLGRIDLAIKRYQKAPRTPPSSGDFYVSLGKAYTQLDKLDLAVSNFRKALTLSLTRARSTSTSEWPRPVWGARKKPSTVSASRSSSTPTMPL